MTAVAAVTYGSGNTCLEPAESLAGTSTQLLLTIPGVRISHPRVNSCRVESSREGIRSVAGSPLVGVAVTLYNVEGQKVATTLTDHFGNWVFDDLAAEDYVLEFSAPNAYPAMSLVRQAS